MRVYITFDSTHRRTNACLCLCFNDTIACEYTWGAMLCLICDATLTYAGACIEWSNFTKYYWYMVKHICTENDFVLRTFALLRWSLVIVLVMVMVLVLVLVHYHHHHQPLHLCDQLMHVTYVGSSCARYMIIFCCARLLNRCAADSTYANVTNGCITRYAFKNNDHELVHSLCLVENILPHVLHLHWP